MNIDIKKLSEIEKSELSLSLLEALHIMNRVIRFGSEIDRSQMEDFIKKFEV